MAIDWIGRAEGHGPKGAWGNPLSQCNIWRRKEVHAGEDEVA